MSRIDQIHQHNRTRERAARTRFVAAWINSRKERNVQLLAALRRCRLSKPAKAQTSAKRRALAVNGGKPILSKSRKDIVGPPGLFDTDLLAELNKFLFSTNRFLGPMKRVFVNKDVTSFNKLGSYMAQLWTKAAVVNNYVIVDNKLAIPEPLREVVLARIHRSHPGQEAMMSASDYIWWLFMIWQIIDTCEMRRECTLFGQNLKPTKPFKTAHSLPTLSGHNQKFG